MHASHGTHQRAPILPQDGTGSGDVDTSEVVEAADDGMLSAACWGGDVTVKVNLEWKNPTG